MEGFDRYCFPEESAIESRDPGGEPEGRTIPLGGGKIIGDADDRSVEGKGV